MLLSKIKDHVDASQSPMAWKRITMRLLPQIRTRGFFMHTFKGDVEIDDELVQLIDAALVDMYDEGLPATFKSN